ncbi:Hypothetical protein FKW44_000813 [Caligus rogercresseyi]|uniref:Uncharacterized protein n=1 Tax=Caligus rogercresseyi TaxID=217165 RepID=A0A7T8KHV2_CALRO|nr:Hypothetical protein FKW44_000813 [Caligus rogercresseyi]
MVTVDECHSMSGKVTTCLIALDKRFSTKGLQTKKKTDAICSTLGKIGSV